MNKRMNEVSNTGTVPSAVASGNSVLLGEWTCGG